MSRGVHRPKSSETCSQRYVVLVNETRIYLVVRDSNRPIAPTIKGMELPVQCDHIISHLGPNGSIDRDGITFERKTHPGIRLVRIAVQASATAEFGIAQH